jgi:hypothetical protein
MFCYFSQWVDGPEKFIIAVMSFLFVAFSVESVLWYCFEIDVIYNYFVTFFYGSVNPIFYWAINYYLHRR